ncbi:MAG: SDR family NAD(P)-dependent oxidoreductase [Desulfitobacteriaceae bacterium]
MGTIGRAYARAHADYGADIALLDDNPNGAEAFLNELRGLGHQAEFYALDVTNIEAIHDTVEIVSREFWKIDILINHVGKNIRKPAVDFTGPEWDKVKGVN